MGILSGAAGRFFPGLFPASALGAAVDTARDRLVRAAEGGRTLDGRTIDPIINAVEKRRQGTLSPEDEKQFYIAYGELNKQIADISKTYIEVTEYPFEDAVSGSEQLLKYAAESGVSVPTEIVSAILQARSALNDDQLTSEIRANFYNAYSTLAGIFGNVTAETIQAGRSKGTRRRLRRRRYFALIVTSVVALLSVVTFMADATSKKITDLIKEGTDLSVRLNDSLFASGADSTIDRNYLTQDPCNYTDAVSGADESREKKIKTPQNIHYLQQFSSVTRDLHSNGIKLNTFVKSLPFAYAECDPYDEKESCNRRDQKAKGDDGSYNVVRFELNPSISNYTAEVLCKSRTFQQARNFASNVNSNFIIYHGAFFSYALPILYAFLGALAYELRAFSDAIRRRTYHYSLTDSARIITAVIAGAISGLFNPAKGLELSPLASAFLIGYGVEIFFRFLDNIMNSLGPGSQTQQKTSA